MSSEIDIAKVANLARIALTEEEKELFSKQLSDILAHVDKLAELDLEGIEPTAHAHPVANVLRPDVATPEECLSREAVLSNAPRKTEEKFIVPKVVE
jgi:aspartyl-tRNA(Asn)/glutamyl-tRNA(Gln) amidotransferase subunit C